MSRQPSTRAIPKNAELQVASDGTLLPDGRGRSDGWPNLCTIPMPGTRDICGKWYWKAEYKGVRYDISPEGEITTTLHVCRTLNTEGDPA